MHHASTRWTFSSAKTPPRSTQGDMDIPTPRARTTSTDTVNKARRRSTRGARALTMRDITNYIRSVYLGRIVYEYCTCIKTERLWFSHILDARSSSSSSRTPALSGAAQKKRNHTLLTAMRDVRSVPPTQDLQPEAICGLEGGKSMTPALDTTIFCCVSRFVFQYLHRGSFLS